MKPIARSKHRRCRALYDGDEKARKTGRTHTCDLPAGHIDALHHCPLCGQWWSATIASSRQ